MPILRSDNKQGTCRPAVATSRRIRVWPGAALLIDRLTTCVRRHRQKRNRGFAEGRLGGVVEAPRTF